MAVAATKSSEQQNNARPAVLVRTSLALNNGKAAQIASFSNLSEAGEHIALLYPMREPGETPLVRLHSECLTGDVLGSAQCDCGSQLHEAQELMSARGGVLLYLRQEGRGIGLYNKISAYHAQREQGLDTFAANRHLGFADDPRNFRVAAEMLTALGITRIRLLTNNPDKVRQLGAFGIIVEDVIPTGRYETAENRQYLEIKKKKGHTL